MSLVRLLSRPLYKVAQRNLVMSFRHRSTHGTGGPIPPLTDFPRIITPNPLFSVRNWFTSIFLINGFFDPGFSLSQFKEGAQHAVVKVSNSLADGDLEELEGCVTPECLDMMGKNLSLFSDSQREALRIPSTDDILKSFVFQVGILMEDHPTEKDQHIRHVEITWVGKVFPNHQHFIDEQMKKAMMTGTPSISQSVRGIKNEIEERGGPLIVNYRFIRDFTKGVEDSWTINAANHFRVLDMDED